MLCGGRIVKGRDGFNPLRGFIMYKKMDRVLQPNLIFFPFSFFGLASVIR